MVWWLRLATGLTARAVHLSGSLCQMHGLDTSVLQLETLMKTVIFHTAWRRSSIWARSFAWVSLAAGVWALSAGSAQAQGVYWSIGVNQPGVSVGVSNAPPVVYQQRPQVVVVERPVIYERPVVYERTVVYQRPVVVQQRPVVVYQTRPYVVTQPVVVYRERGYRRDDDRHGYKRDKWHKRHDRHRDRWDD